MFPTIIPETFAGVLAAYATCFQARSYPTFQWLVLGWVQCLERRTTHGGGSGVGGRGRAPYLGVPPVLRPGASV